MNFLRILDRDNIDGSHDQVYNTYRLMAVGSDGARPVATAAVTSRP
jgi:hypothetical protein